MWIANADTPPNSACLRPAGDADVHALCFLVSGVADDMKWTRVSARRFQKKFGKIDKIEKIASVNRDPSIGDCDLWPATPNLSVTRIVGKLNDCG
jgi:hypothetical protein